MDYGIYAGDTDATIYLRLRDSTTGLAKTGLAYNSAGAVASYTLPRAARAAITLATQTVTGAHSDGGFVEVDATNAKGLYRLDLPDAAIASGAYTCISIEFDGTIEETVLVPLHRRKVDLDTIKTQAVTCGAGVTVLASVGTAATSTAQTGDTYALANGAAGFVAIDTVVDAILADTGTDGVVVAAASKTGYTLTASTGLGNQTADITGNLSGSVGSVTGAVGAVTGAVGSVTGAVGSVTGNVGGNVTGSVGSVVGAVGSVATGVTLANGVTHGGTTALLRLGSTTSTPAFYATNSGGDAVQFTSSSASGHGLATGGGTSGRGISATGAHGIFGQGTSSGIVGYGTGGASAGIIGQSAGVVGYGFLGTCTTANGAGASYIGGTGGYSIYAPGHIFGNVLGSVGSVLGGINTTSGTITTLDALDTAQDLQHAATQGATFDAATDSLEAIRNRGDAAWITATGFSTLDAAGIRTAVGLAAANLDDQLGDIPTVAEFEARTLVAASYFDPAADTVAHVTLVDTTTTNTDMRGTDSAATAADVNAQVLDVVNVDTIVAGVPIAEALRRVGAITAGQVSGAGTGTETFMDFAESAASIVVTVDGSGNRSSVVFN